jgi:release factor glutamine methyltransferase
VTIADLGTGSGCLAVTLAAERGAAKVWATDISQSALEVASRNARRHGVAERIDFILGDFGKPLIKKIGTGTFDLVVSNPPYGAASHMELFERQVLQYEPHLALFSGEAGTEAIQMVIPQAGLLLHAGGVLLIEIGIGQSDKINELFAEGWSKPEIYPDLHGIPRCVRCVKQ